MTPRLIDSIESAAGLAHGYNSFWHIEFSDGAALNLLVYQHNRDFPILELMVRE